MKLVPIGIAGVAVTALTLSGPVFSAGGEYVDNDGPSSSLEIAYNMYVGGIPFGRAAMVARFQGDTYRASSSLETQGIVNRFWQAKIETASNGVIAEDRVQPAVYDSFSSRRSGQRQEVTLRFDPEGPSSLYSNPAYDVDRFPIPEDKKRHSLDPLSAVVFLTTSYEANDGSPCGITAPIFDGRRRYDIAFDFVRTTDIRMDNGIYSGPVLVCKIEYRQVAGYEQRIVDRGGRIPNMYAWIATIQSASDPDRRYMVPLRLWAETEYGLVVAVASYVKLDGTDLGRTN